MSFPSKILFLGMDAADKFLLQKWASDETLPTIRSIFDKGLVGDTISPVGFFIGSVWPSFYTGSSPANHGFHYLVQIEPGTYDFFRCNPDEFLKRQPFWNNLSQAGRKVAILDIPLSFITKNLNGIQIVEWGSHDSVYNFCTEPNDFKKEVLSKFGSYPIINTCNSCSRTQKGFNNFKDLLIRGVEKKTDLTKYYLNQGSWDFFAQVFTESHCVGHQCWHLHDSSHPGHDPHTVAKIGNPLRDVYMAIDSAIQKILTQVDDNTIVIFLAGHGMNYFYGANFLLPEILIQLKFAQTIPMANSRLKPLRTNRLETLLTYYWRKAPPFIKTEFRPILYHLRNKIHGNEIYLPASMAKIDRRKSRCFPVFNGNLVSGIRVNLKEREPEGQISIGNEFNNFYKELRQELLKIVDIDYGKPIVKNVFKTIELYQGHYIDHLPDILIEWNDERPLGSNALEISEGSTLRLTSDSLGTIEGTNNYCRTGDHRPEGIFAIMGPGIKSRRLNRTVSIMDFAPTIAKLLSVDITDVDGAFIPEIWA
jgi:predicted AlkP superfamily phosphohydrolase/phosphomutase